MYFKQNQHKSSTGSRHVLLINTLLCMGLLDEIAAGFPTVGLPLLRDHLHLSYAQAGLLFTVGSLSGLIFDPLLNLLSDSGSKRYWILSGLLLLIITDIFTGLASNFALLVLIFILAAPISEAAIGLSQAAVVDFYPTNSSRVMARWTLLSGIGDMLSPFVIAAIAALQFGWTTLFLLAASLWIVPVLIVASHPFPHTDAQDNEHQEHAGNASTGLLSTFRSAIRNPHLLRWAALTVIPTMMDEMFLSFTALYLHDVLHINQAMIGLIIGIHLFGALLGLFILDRFLSRRIYPLSTRTLLILLSLIVLLVLIVFLTIHLVWVTVFALFVVGLGAANWYPLAKGEAYRLVPGHTGTVRAVISLFNLVDVILPVLVGIIAGNFGIVMGVSILCTAPLLMLLLLLI